MNQKNLVVLSLLLGLMLAGCGGSSNGDDSGSDSGSGSDSAQSSNNTVYHYQGTSCFSCHGVNVAAVKAENKSFLSGGTVYTALNATAATQYATGYTIRALLNTNLSVNYISGRGDGNSYSSNSALSSPYTFTAQVVNSSGVVVNSSATNSHSTASKLDCNACHTSTGTNGAPGRIYIKMQVVAPTPTPTPVVAQTALSFATDVMPVLINDCRSCHGDNGAFTITTATATYANIASFSGIDTANPTNSRLLTKANGVNHGGGSRWNITDTSYITVKDWITQGALNN